MENVTIDLSSVRARKARFSRLIGGVWVRIMTVMAVVLVVSGVGLVVIAQPIGWLLVSVATILYMVVTWYNGELTSIPVAPNPTTIDDVLASDILGQITATTTPQDIARIVGLMNGGMFFGVRFGLTASFLQNIAPGDQAQMQTIWRHAFDVYTSERAASISSDIVVVALVRAFPDYQTLLNHLHLDDEDLLRGVRWQLHLAELIAHHGRPRRTGGIARDWSFGYIPLLTRFGQNMSEQIARGGGSLSVELEAHTQAIDQLAGTFSHGGRQNAVLVGPTGVGKTTIISAFAEYLLDAEADLPSTLKFNQVFILDASALIAAAPGRGELENLVMRVLGEAYTAKNIIICLDNAQLFFQEGIGSVDLTNILLPILEAGRLRIILTMDEQRYLQIAQKNPGLINALNRVSVAEANKNETIAVLQDQLIMTEFQRKVTYTYQSLEEIYRLSLRYVHDLAMPGRAMKLLESAAGYSENGIVTINSVQQAIEQTMNIKVGVAQGSDERDVLLHLEERIHERMISQERAVRVVSDALRRARAGVRNQNRPIGTFLFLGPTGVGKTELAKALASVYFGGEDRMIRLDMNEYVRAADVTRLIADGATDPSSLTASIMKQPFSVILLDEIEKAHPQVLTTLLQLLDEGVLRDIKNREVSFRDAIVIATSNAGADRIREYVERGYVLEQFEKQFVDELISSNQFRPEFLNRFDEIVTFSPLTRDDLVKVVDLMIQGVNATLALQKVSVRVSDDAKLYLVEQGYDPRLGARPMRRVVQRAVENTVANQMLAGEVAPGSVIEINKDQVQKALESYGPLQAS